MRDNERFLLRLVSATLLIASIIKLMMLFIEYPTFLLWWFLLGLSIVGMFIAWKWSDENEP